MEIVEWTIERLSMEEHKLLDRDNWARFMHTQKRTNEKIRVMV